MATKKTKKKIASKAAPDQALTPPISVQGERNLKKSLCIQFPMDGLFQEEWYVRFIPFMVIAECVDPAGFKKYEPKDEEAIVSSEVLADAQFEFYTRVDNYLQEVRSLIFRMAKERISRGPFGVDGFGAYQSLLHFTRAHNCWPFTVDNKKMDEETFYAALTLISLQDYYDGNTQSIWAVFAANDALAIAGQESRRRRWETRRGTKGADAAHVANRLRKNNAKEFYFSGKKLNQWRFFADASRAISKEFNVDRKTADGWEREFRKEFDLSTNPIGRSA